MGSPAKIFDSLFGSGLFPGAAAPGGRATDPAVQARQHKSVLEGIRADIARMNAKLAQPERVKLDQYMTSLRALELRVASIQTESSAMSTTCTKPAAPTDTSASLTPKIVAAHIDLQFAAHLCGLTRVSQFSLLGDGAPHNPYSWLGDTKGYHVVHRDHENDRAMVVKIATWVMTQVARLAELLDKTPEGNGTMLDNSLLTYVNICGGVHHNGWDTYSVQTLGKAGGSFKTGQYLAFPPKTRSLADVWVTLANALDVPIKTFGVPEHNRGVLPGLL